MNDPHLDIAMFAIYAGYDRQEIDRLFDRYSADGRIAVPTETVAYIGSV